MTHNEFGGDNEFAQLESGQPASRNPRVTPILPMP